MLPAILLFWELRIRCFKCLKTTFQFQVWNLGHWAPFLAFSFCLEKPDLKLSVTPLHDIMIFWILCLDHDKWQIKHSNFTAVSLCCFTLSPVFSLVLSLILRSVPIYIVFQLLLEDNSLEKHTTKNTRMDCKVEKEI